MAMALKNCSRCFCSPPDCAYKHIYHISYNDNDDFDSKTTPECFLVLTLLRTCFIIVSGPGRHGSRLKMFVNSLSLSLPPTSASGFLIIPMSCFFLSMVMRPESFIHTRDMHQNVVRFSFRLFDFYYVSLLLYFCVCVCVCVCFIF